MSDARRDQGGVLGTLFRYEIRMLLRDRRTILIAVVAPLVLFPLILLVTRRVDRSAERRLEETTYRYAVTGSQADWARGLVSRARAWQPADTDTTVVPVRFEEVGGAPVSDSVALDSLLEAGDLHLVIRGLSAREWREIRAQERLSEEEATEAEETDGQADATSSDDRVEVYDTLYVPAVRIEYRESSDFSRRASDLLRRRLVAVRGERRDSLYRTAGFPVEPERVAEVELRNTASAAKEGGAMLGLALTPFLLFLMLSGGSIVAADAISGEKERGTLETLLTSAATRAEIVTAKQLAIAAVGVAVVVVNVLNLLVYLGLGVFELPEDFAVALQPWDPVILLALLLPLTVLIASALLLLSGYSRTYKEYQIYFFPLFLVVLVFSLAALLPGIELRSAIALVPISGVAVAVREVMVGTYDWPFLALTFAATCAAAWGMARLTERTLSTERLISQADLDRADLAGGPALFPRHVLRWFLVMWAGFFVISLWLGESVGLRGQVALNLVVLFFGASLLMLRRYRLDPRKALALRSPHPAVWLAVVVGAPSALVLGVGLSQLVNAWIFPVPERVIEAFGQAMTGESLPLWQLLLFLCVMPGVFEEIAFRGMLLHGLTRRMHPVWACLVVGAVFGLFHVALFRILPTAYLGVVLAAVTLVSGSIFPAMLWHALNNALAVVPGELGWVAADQPLPPGAYPAAVVGFLVAAFVLWRYRRPYPGLRTGRRRPLEVVHGEAPAVG